MYCDTSLHSGARKSVNFGSFYGTIFLIAIKKYSIIYFLKHNLSQGDAVCLWKGMKDLGFWEKKEQHMEEEKYRKDYQAEITTINAKRLRIAFILVGILEFFLIVSRILESGRLITNTLSVVSCLKFVMCVIFLLTFSFAKCREKELPQGYRYVTYVWLVLFGVIQQYLTYDEILDKHTIYNHLYFVVVLAYLIYPPKKSLPLFAFFTVSGYVILLFSGAGEEIVGNNVFALTVFSLIGPLASYVIYRTHFTGYINKDKLNQATITDPLTQIYNRRGFQSKVDELNGEYNRHDDMVAAIMLDVDSFKAYNDHYGHDAGDRCLQAIASVFSKLLYRNGELFARFGGEEFAVVIYGNTKKYAAETAAQICSEVERLAIAHTHSRVAGKKVITISAGVAWTPKLPVFYMQDLLKEADKNMYEAKKRGGNMAVSPEQ